MICKRCSIELAPQKVQLEYLGHKVEDALLVCPSCGNVYIPEDVVTGKIQKLEKQLEDK
jgi:uncharacterized Zn finger protein